MPKSSVLFVLDQDVAVEGYQRKLTDFDLHFCHDPDAALPAIAQIKPTVVVLAYRSASMSPLTMAQSLRGDPSKPYTGLVYVSNHEANDWLERMLQAGADLCLPESHTMPQLLAGLESIERLCEAKQELFEVNERLHKAYGRLAQLSLTDELTGFGNELYLMNQLRTEFKRAQRYQKHLALLFLSIDTLEGTQVLSPMQEALIGRVGQTVSRSIRFEIDHTGRSGESQFYIILPETDIDGAIVVAERIRKKIAQLHSTPDQDHLCSSIGLAHYHGDRGNFDNFEMMISIAQKALEAANLHGGDQYWALDSLEDDLSLDRSA